MGFLSPRVEDSCPRLNNGTVSFLWNGAERFWAERMIGKISLNHTKGNREQTWGLWKLYLENMDLAAICLLRIQMALGIFLSCLLCWIG